jgi:site-specific DNA-methyltransferase (adenine-specific)
VNRRFDLRLGSCLEPLAGLPGIAPDSFDVVISDPPYRNTPDLGVGQLEPEQIDLLCRELARLTKRWVVIFTDVESVGLWQQAYVAAGLEYIRTGVWIKPNAAPQRSGDRPSVGFEAIVMGHRPGRKRWNGGGHTAVWTCTVEQQGRVHPTQKPLALMEKLVQEFSDPRETICDPFAGAGSTGVAALYLGRHFVGWELQEQFHAAATARLDGAREQVRLFEPPANDVEQHWLAGLDPKQEVA